MGWINLGDPAPPGFFSGAIPDPTPDGPTPEEEREMERARECQNCDHGRVLIFYCEGVCECGRCPDVGDCPECCGR